MMQNNRPGLGFGPSRTVRFSSDQTGLWRRRTATLSAGALAFVMGYGVIFGHNGLTAFAAKRREKRLLESQMLQFQKENARLQGHVDRLASDPSAIEHEARQEFHYTRPGEVIYTLPVDNTGNNKR